MTILDRFRLDNKVAIVTGGSKGLGWAMAQGLSEAGAHVVVCSRDVVAVQACAEEYGGKIGELASIEEVPPTLPDVSTDAYAVWQKVRKGAQRMQRASTILNRIDQSTYPEEGSWAASLQKQTDITIRTLVDRTFELTARRRPGHAVLFIIDEVGAYVARSAEKIASDWAMRMDTCTTRGSTF